MDIERERGITIKAQNVRLTWHDHIIHLIDTPGHVDFGYEVSRSLAACEGVILLVDASQGIEAQTLANCYLALEHDLEIVAALNKIDLPAADPDRVAGEIEQVLGIPADEILRISAKTGEGVPELLDAVDRAHPAADGRCRRAAAGADLRLVLRPVPRRGERGAGDERHAAQRRTAALHAGGRHPRRRGGRRAPARADAGGRARPRRGRLPHRRHQGRGRGACRRDGHRRTARPGAHALAGYRDPKPMVFCGLYPVEGDDFADLREALEKLRLNDSSFTYEPETSGALGFGFRCGFLGLLHMEIVRERLEREFDLSLIATAPSVEYQVDAHHTARRWWSTTRAAMPPASEIELIEEPFFTATILLPTEYTGTVMDLCQTRRGEMAEDGVPVRGAASSSSTASRWPRSSSTSSTS